jgi:molecular chaperone DnaJ
VLGVARDADMATIRRAYRERARSVHPDRQPAGSADEMAAVNEAWRVLGEPGRRALYDRALEGPVSSAVPASDHTAPSAHRGHNRAGYNYRGDLAPARIPWRFMSVMAVLGVMLVLFGVVFFEGPSEPRPDGIIRSGSCVEIEPNGDAREVACTGDNDLVVDQLVPYEGRCRTGTVPHRDRLGLGIACVIPLGRS